MLEAIGDRVIIKRVNTETKLPSGIVLPETESAPKGEGIVIAAGQGAWLQSGARGALSVKTGDRVYFNPFVSASVVHDGKTYLVLSEADIYAVIR